MACGTHRSWRSWETCGAFRAWWPLQEHAWFDDGGLSLLTFLAPWPVDPFEDGVLVRWHARPDLGRGDGGVVVGVVVVVLQALDGFLGELALQVILPFPGRCRIRGVGGADRAGGNLSPCAVVGGLVRVLDALDIAEILVRGWRVVVLAGHVVIVPYARVLLFPSPLAGVRHLRGHRGGQGQLLGNLRGLFSSFHRLLGGGRLLAWVVRVLVVGVLVVISLAFPLSFWVVFVWVGVLGLGRVGDGSVTVRTVVLTVIISRPVVRDEEQLLDITLKDVFIQNPGAEHNDAIGVDHGVVTAVQEFRGLLFTVQDQSDVFLVDAERNSVPLAI